MLGKDLCLLSRSRFEQTPTDLLSWLPANSPQEYVKRTRRAKIVLHIEEEEVEVVEEEEEMPRGPEAGGPSFREKGGGEDRFFACPSP